MPVSWARFSAGAAIFAVAASGAALSPIGARAIQSKLQSAAANALASHDLDFASARADGRTLVLSGIAPEPGLLGEAIKIAAAIPGVWRVDAGGLSVAASAMAPPVEETPSPPPAPALEPPLVIDLPSAADCQAALNRTLNGRRLTYRLESARLSTIDRALLGDLADAIKSCAKQTIIIEGHTDSAGSKAANLQLSERRARAVEAYLSQFDLPVTLVVRAHGESRPIASNSSVAGRSANRRIDFVVEAPPPETPAESD